MGEETTEEKEEEIVEESIDVVSPDVIANLVMGAEAPPMYAIQFGEFGMQVWPTASTETSDELLRILKNYIKKHIAREEAEYCSDLGEDSGFYA